MEFIKRIEVDNQLELEEIKEKLQQQGFIVMTNDRTLTINIYINEE